jgi:hypothetical protein
MEGTAEYTLTIREPGCEPELIATSKRFFVVDLAQAALSNGQWPVMPGTQVTITQRNRNVLDFVVKGRKEN